MDRFDPELRVFRPTNTLRAAFEAAGSVIGVRRSLVVSKLAALRGALGELGWLGDDGFSIVDVGGTVVDTLTDGDQLVGGEFTRPDPELSLPARARGR